MSPGTDGPYSWRTKYSRRSAAATPAGAIARLLEMGLEPFQLTSAIYGVMSQRLLRRKAGDQYEGRLPVAEFVVLDEPLRRAVLNRADAAELERVYASQQFFRPMREAAVDVIRAGATDEAELIRVLGAG